MKTRHAAIAIVVAAVAVVAWRMWPRKPAAPPPPAYAFDMCVGKPTASPTHNTWNDGVLSAVARTLSPEERGALEEALGNAATRWEAKANPMLEDLEGGDPDGPIIAWFKTGPTFLRTAQAAAKLRTCAPDGFCVSPRAIGGPCPPDSAPPATADEADRARFVLWPWGHALRFRATSPELAHAAAATLREQARSSHTIAIVLSADDAAVTQVAPFATMRERWRKVGGLQAAARRQRTPPPAFTIEERADEVIVLPRLDAIAAGTPDKALADDVTAGAPQLAPAP